jgi:hypothetical protein
MDMDGNDYYCPNLVQAEDGMDCGDSGIGSNDSTERNLLADAQDAFRRHVLSDAGVDMSDDGAAASSGGGADGGGESSEGVESDQSMCDTQSIEMSEVKFPLVMIKLPSIYPNANERGTDKVVWNKRAIPYEKFISWCTVALEIVAASPEKQINLSKRLMTHIITVIPANEDTRALSSLVDMAIGLAYDVNSKTNYIDVTNRGLQFDRIVQCQMNADTDQLAVVPASYDGRYFYSQIKNPSEVNAARMAMNDQDLFRAYRTIAYMTGMMTNERDHLCHGVSTYINLGLLLQCLVLDSIMIAGEGRNDLRAAYIALLVDTLFRSRVTTWWGVRKESQLMLTDIIRSHHPAHYIARAMALDTAEARFNLFKNSPNNSGAAGSEDLARILAKIDYRTYMGYLQSNAVHYGEERFYMMDSRTFLYIMSLLPMDALGKQGGVPKSQVGVLVGNLRSQLSHLATAVPLGDDPPNKRSKFE